MNNQRKNHSILKVMFLSFITLAFLLANSFAAETQSSDPNRYLDAVREFADNVLKYGRDTYGPKQTPLFVDGINVNTHEPVKWISPAGGDPLTATETEEWILSNFASQQTLLRTLDGLSTLTGDSKYREAAIQATKYAFDNLRAPNGLFYWGEVTAYDALHDEIRSSKEAHALKVNYPYYELMWQVNPEATKRFIEAYWSAHIIDWSNLDFNRSVENISTLNVLETPWDHEYKGGPNYFRSKISWAAGFHATGTSLAQAATTLYQLSGQEKPLMWGKLLIQRFVDARNPNTGIIPRTYNNLGSPPFVGGGMEAHFKDPSVGVFPINPFVDPHTEVRGLYLLQDINANMWLSVLLMGDMLGEQGEEFSQWAQEELTAWGKASYRAEDNVFMPILTDGTSIEGIVIETGPGASSGSVAEPEFVDAGFLWAYATAYKATGDKFMWQMTRDIARGHGFGDIGTELGQSTALHLETTNADAYCLLGFLELYNKTKNRQFLAIARRIADNILATKFHNGFFVPSNKHVYTLFDCFEPLAILHLISVLISQQELTPRVWPSYSNFVAPYRYKEEGIDRRIIYTLTDTSEPPLSLQEAAAIGDVNAVRSLLENGTYVDNVEDPMRKTALTRAVIGSHKDVVELLLSAGADVNISSENGNSLLGNAVQNNNIDLVNLFLSAGADVNIKDGNGRTPLFVAVQNGNINIVKLLLDAGADVNAKDRIGMTALILAIRDGNKEVVELLVNKGADVNAKTNSGMTPLYAAVSGNHVDIVKFLLDKGADANISITRGARRNAGSSIRLIDMAQQRGQTEIVELLKQHGAEESSSTEDDNTEPSEAGATPQRGLRRGG